VIDHILADPSARLLTFGNPGYLDFSVSVCVKTGTSSNYRDNWIIGYTPRHIVGIWAGNFSGSPSRGATAAGSCGPILREIVDHLYASGSPGHFTRPPRVWEGSICWMSGKLAGPNCPYATKELFIGDSSSAEHCDFPHEPGQFYYLGGTYAWWIRGREIEQGTSRFRLITGERPLAVSSTAGRSGSMSRDRRPSTGEHKSITIVSPHDADHFVTSPHMPLRVRLHAVADPVVSHLIWLVDGLEVARTPPPYEFFWEPSRGRHVIHAVTPDMEAAQAAIIVE
jgi:membrane carboxypeptidase/penicillin-binding protein PbpC